MGQVSPARRTRLSLFHLICLFFSCDRARLSTALTPHTTMITVGGELVNLCYQIFTGLFVLYCTHTRTIQLYIQLLLLVLWLLHLSGQLLLVCLVSRTHDVITSLD